MSRKLFVLTLVLLGFTQDSRVGVFRVLIFFSYVFQDVEVKRALVFSGGRQQATTMFYGSRCPDGRLDLRDGYIYSICMYCHLSTRK